MDPDAALARLRELLEPTKVDAMIEDTNTQNGEVESALTEAAELFAALDSWMSKGGFAPGNWKR